MKGMKRVKEWEEVFPYSEKILKKHILSSMVKKVVKEIGVTDVIDYGCGNGELCTIFPHSSYLGLDIDEKKLQLAQTSYQQYQFKAPEEKIYSTQMCIAIRVFSEMEDDVIDDLLRCMRCKWLLVIDDYQGVVRSTNIYPLKNRKKEQYIKMMRNHDLLLMKQLAEEVLDQENQNVFSLLFKKCGRNPGL